MSDPSPELTDPLADRYCEIAELLVEIDLDALDRKIARLIRLRDAVSRLRGACPVAVPAPVPAVVPPPPTDNRLRGGDRRPHGFWVEFIKQCIANGDTTVDAMMRRLSNPGRLDRNTLKATLGRYGRMFRKLDTAPPTWELIPRDSDVKVTA